MKTCQQVLAENPNHAEALVWHGAGLFGLSGQAFQEGDFQKGGELWQRGLKEMDDAVVLEPDNVGVRIPRGASLLMASRHVPPNRKEELLERTVADYERALELQEPYLDHISDHARGELLSGLAEAWNRIGDSTKARGFFERVVKEVRDSVYAESARKWLDAPSPAKRPTEFACMGCHVK